MDQFRLFKAILLRLIGAGLAVLTDTYANTLFLSTYSKDKIPYLYLALAFFGFLFIQFSQPFIDRHFARYQQISTLFFIGFLFVCLYVTGLTVTWFPFIAAVYIITAAIISQTTLNISVMNLFGLREFKANSPWLNLTMTVGTIATGFLIWLILHYLNLNSLLYLIIGLLIAFFALSFFIPSHFNPLENTKHARPKIILHKDRFFILCFASAYLVLLLYILSDYSLKSLLSHQFTQNQIAQFLGPLVAISYVCAIVTQLFLLPWVLRRLDVTGLLLITPAAFLLAALCVLIYPNLWTVTFLMGIGLVTRASFFNPGYQILLNVYAPTVQRTVQFKIQSWGRLGMSFCAILLIFLTLIGALRLLALAIIAAALVTIYVGITIGKYYVEKLKTAINLHRFHTDYLATTKMDIEITLKTALQAISSKKEDLILFGLTLLSNVKLKKVPTPVFKFLGSEFYPAKKLAIKVMEISKDRSVVKPLMKQLSEEKNPEFIWALVNAILRFSRIPLLPYATDTLSSQNPAIKAAAIRILLTVGDPDQSKFMEKNSSK